MSKYIKVSILESHYDEDEHDYVAKCMVNNKIIEVVVQKEEIDRGWTEIPT